MQIVEERFTFLEYQESRMTIATDLATLTERVANHIRFFWVVVGFGFAWLIVVSGFLWSIHGQLGNVQTAQANIPAQTVDALLAKPASSPSEMAQKLGAVSAVLQSAKIGSVKADPVLVSRISAKISAAQTAYPELPQVWEATGALIDYKSDVLSHTVGPIPGQQCDTVVEGSEVTYTNCEVFLELEVKNIVINNRGKSGPHVFVNCLVHYGGGLLPPGPLLFSNSVFRFNVPIVPSPQGQRAMQQLTTADLSKEVDLQLGE
jgi:hypothetical protein